ncbi:MAG: hypothetical protein V4508_07465 [Pseudomonadota bacterium]
MRKILTLLSLTACLSAPALAQVSVQIGIDVPVYPLLQPVPGYPVYYAPQLRANYFFYDGLYWVYEQDGWYESPWYNGPWRWVSEDQVPLFVLRVPVRYYRQAPPLFLSWQRDAPPRWDRVWGQPWAQRHRDWDHWNRAAAPRPAPLPTFQRNYSRDRYPDADARQRLQQHYVYQPRDAIVREHVQKQREPQGPRVMAPAPQARPMHESPHVNAPAPVVQHTAPPRHEERRERPMPEVQRPAPPQHEERRERPMPEVQRPAPQHQEERHAERPAPEAHVPPGRAEGQAGEHHGRPEKGDEKDKHDDHDGDKRK